jgi:glycine hydroxymethyltransferase
VQLRDLRAESSGADMRVDIALQGPNSRKILLDMKMSAEAKRQLRKLTRFHLMQAEVDGIDLIISRTGYTGEWWSFELFVHPDKAVNLWNALMKAGEPHGLQPCGLGARDSLRIEAGLPLYGQELAGPLDLGPADAGFRNFVATYKPWFIGRAAFLAKEEERGREVVRFRFPERSRMAHQGDPITDADGAVIGEVTSCSLDAEGTLTGQAYVDKAFTKKGSTFVVYQGMHGKELTADAKGTEAVVLKRF